MCRFFVIFLFMLSFMTVSSQTIYPRIGFGFSTLAVAGGNIDTEVSSKFKMHVGATYERLVKKDLFFQTGLVFEGKGCNESGSEGAYSVERKYNPVYLVIPVAIRYYFQSNSDLKFFGNGGFYAGIGVGGKAKQTIDDYGFVQKESVKIFGDDAFKRLDFGLELGGGVKLPFNSTELEIGMLLSFGLTNVGDASVLNVNSAKNQAYKIYVSMPIKLKK